MDKNWRLRGYTNGDEHDINALFNSIFKRTRTLENWYWKFKKNPDGFKILIVEDDDNLIAHLSSIHRKIKIGQEEAFTSLEVDGMTHPDYGRRGLFVTLGKRLLSELEKEGVDIVLGFPNENALPGHKRLNCIELFIPAVMIKPLNFKSISNKLYSNL